MTLPIQKPGAPETLFATSARAARNARHAHARLVEFAADLGQALLQDRDRLGMKFERNAEGLGDAFGGDVVMRRPDAAGGEHIGVFRAQRVERLDDRGLVVGDHPHFLQVDADRGEIIGDVADVLVLGAARQNLVADDKHGRGDDLGAWHWHAHGSFLGRARDVAWRWQPLKPPDQCARPPCIRG